MCLSKKKHGADQKKEAVVHMYGSTHSLGGVALCRCRKKNNSKILELKASKKVSDVCEKLWTNSKIGSTFFITTDYHNVRNSPLPVGRSGGASRVGTDLAHWLVDHGNKISRIWLTNHALISKQDCVYIEVQQDIGWWTLGGILIQLHAQSRNENAVRMLNGS